MGKTEKDRALEAKSKERLGCFCCCNVNIPECVNKAKDGSPDNCKALADCLIGTRLYNKSYDPNKPEEAGKNEPTFSYKEAAMPVKLEVEASIEAENMKALDKPAPAAKRERAPKAAAPAPAPAPAPVPEDDINSVLEDLTKEGSRAADIRASDLGDLADQTNADASEPPPEAVEKAADDAMQQAINQVVKTREGVPAKAATVITADIKAMEYIIDYAADAFAKALIQVLSGVGKITLEVPVAKSEKPAEKAAEAPATRKRGAK